ncbi:MAG: DUF3093 domain-containing protein [Streptosporangiales bacterium]
MSFDERLWVPWWWWLFGALVIALLGAEIHVGFSWIVAVVTYLVLGGLAMALLLRWGSARTRVADGVLEVRTGRLPLGHITDVRVLDRSSRRAVLASQASRSAVLQVRGYAKGLVYVATDGTGGLASYWLISSRHPRELATALGYHCAYRY